VGTKKDATTVAGARRRKPRAPRSKRYFALTLAYHRDHRRIGERVLLELEGELLVSRKAPEFGPPGEKGGTPLESSHVSRKPIRIAVTTRGARIIRAESGSDIVVGAEPLEETIDVTPAELDRGVWIAMGDDVALLAHWLVLPTRGADAPVPRLVGASSGMDKLRRQIHRVAPHDVPVLLQGKTGTGKELVASAIHELSPRADAPFVSVNLGAIPASTAAAALFGHEKGAFTGATASSPGYFGRADGGTLFLDEVAEAPEEVQVALLRALESGEVQPVGGTSARKVDVRLIAATDANLDEQMEEGKFRVPLMMRLSGYELHLPPLRERRDDIPRLLLHFMREQLRGLGNEELLDDGDEAPWLPLWLMEACLDHDWPGNVRQLRNVVQQWIIDYAEQPQIDREALAVLDRALTRSGSLQSSSGPASAPEPAPVSSDKRSIDDVTEDELVAALERNEFKPGPAAAELGVPRSSIYTLMEKSDRIGKATDLDEPGIQRALDDNEGDIKAAALALRVSARGLRLRMKALGMT
jgi:two-component system nitrogen regulation response regulator GlnG